MKCLLALLSVEKAAIMEYPTGSEKCETVVCSMTSPDTSANSEKPA